MADFLQRENIVKDGELSFKLKGHLIKKLKKHQARLFQQSSSGVARLEIYESEKDRRTGSYCLLIPGSEVVSVREHINLQSSDEKNGFVISTKEQQHIFCTNSKEEQHDWILQTTSTLLQPYLNAGQKHGPNQSVGVTEENDLYEPAEEFLREFRVTPGYETRRKTGLDEEVRLLVENGHITIITLQGNRGGRWGIEHLRRFGYNDTDFHFEAGRKSEYGEGSFSFVTKQGKQIHTLVAQEKKRARISREAELARRPMLNPGQIQAAIDDDDIPLSTGNHLYEEVPTKWFADKKKNVPDKPARQITSKSLQPANSSLGSGPEEPKYENMGSSNGSGTLLRQMPKVKSQPTGSAVGPAKGHFQPAAEAFKTMAQNPNPGRPRNDVYSEPMVHKDAWKTHGIGDSPTEEDHTFAAPTSSSSSMLVRDAATSIESEYACLEFTTSKNILHTPKEPRAYENTNPALQRLLEEMSGKQSDNEARSKTEEQIKSEPIYAVVCKPKKNPKEPEFE